MRARWQDHEDAVLRSAYATVPTPSIAGALGRTASSVAQRARALGLSKSPELIAAMTRAAMADPNHGGRSSRFAKGMTPWNAGVKGSTGTHERCRATQFKKGRPAHEAANYLPIGSTRICKDGYLERKVTDDAAIAPARRWVAVHRLVWEAACGAVPEGHAVVFKPGRRSVNEADITADALECITRAELMRRNTYHRYGPEIASVIQLRGVIQRQINKRAKEAATS